MTDPWSAVRARVAGARDRYMTRLPSARKCQEAVLARILALNARGAYGSRYRFGTLGSVRQYQQSVPIVSYEDIEADIHSIADRGVAALTADPVIALERTGGSRGGAKLIPYTDASLDAFRTALLPWLDDLLLSYPGISNGAAYWAVSPVARASERTASGIRIGLESDAEYFGAELAQAIAETLALPPAIARIADVDAWRFVTLTSLLAREDLAFISAWSPSFIAELLRPLSEPAAADEVLNAIAAGNYLRYDAAAQAAVMPRLEPAPERSRALEATLRRRDWVLKDLWPRLSLLSCWTHASSRIFLPRMAGRLDGVAVQGKGLIATEAIVSLPLASLPYPVLAVESAFYEFLDGSGRALLCDELAVGEHYSVVLTTLGGLYRYRIGDLVAVRGYVGEAPLLEFTGREGPTADLVGEKLREDFVLEAIKPLVDGFWMLAAVTDGSPHYRLVAEARESGQALAAAADRALCLNPQYAYARSLGQLGPVRVSRCPDLAHRWLMRASQNGKRIGDVKPPVLVSSADLDFLGSAQP